MFSQRLRLLSKRSRILFALEYHYTALLVENSLAGYKIQRSFFEFFWRSFSHISKMILHFLLDSVSLWKNKTLIWMRFLRKWPLSFCGLVAFLNFSLRFLNIITLFKYDFSLLYFLWHSIRAFSINLCLSFILSLLFFKHFLFFSLLLWLPIIFLLTYKKCAPGLRRFSLFFYTFFFPFFFTFHFRLLLSWRIL